jgi:hypothetical protein
MAEEPKDPTKDPEFQKVIRHFVTTPHIPHRPIGPKGDKTQKKGRARPKQPEAPGD